MDERFSRTVKEGSNERRPKARKKLREAYRRVSKRRALPWDIQKEFTEAAYRRQTFLAQPHFSTPSPPHTLLTFPFFPLAAPWRVPIRLCPFSLVPASFPLSRSVFSCEPFVNTSTDPSQYQRNALGVTHGVKQEIHCLRRDNATWPLSQHPGCDQREISLRFATQYIFRSPSRRERYFRICF